IPLIVIGAALITNIITKFPIFVWAGAALLGWIAGEMIIGDAAALAHLGLQVPEQWHYAAATCGAVLVVAIGYLMKPKDQKLA
ncbi:MAG: TerC family protein, partial [Aestuariivirga sp.]